MDLELILRDQALKRLELEVENASLIQVADLVRSRSVMLEDERNAKMYGSEGATEMRLRYSREIEVILGRFLDLTLGR